MKNYKLPLLKNDLLNCPIIIATSNDFLPLLKPFSYLFNEFWGQHQKVTFIGYKKPNFSLPDNFSFESLGVQRGVKYWSDDIRPFIEKLDCDYFVYTAEDMFLARKVNFNSLKNLLSYSKELKCAPGRIALGDSVSNQKNVSNPKNSNFIIQTSDSNYRLSLQWSLWKKDYFLNYLHPYYSQWDFEIRNMSRARYDGVNIVGLKENYPMGFCNASVTRGATENLNFDNAVYDFTDICSHRDKSMRTYLNKKYIKKMVELDLISMENLK